MEFLSFLALGIFVGTFGAFLGVGGSLFLVTIFMFTMLAPNGSTFTSVQQVAATGLFAVACNAISGVIAYVRQKRLFLRITMPLAISTAPGAFAASYISQYFTGPGFTAAFGCLLLVLGLLLLWNTNSNYVARPYETFDPKTAHINFPLGMTLMFFIGFFSTIFGIGSGAFAVPMMVLLLGFPTQIATASAMYILMASSIIGSIGNAIHGTIVWLPAISIGLGCVIGAQIGAHLSKKCNPKIIIGLFAIVLVLLGCQFIRKGFF